MKSVIFYFSQIITGNTKRVAEKIAEGLRTNNNQCDLIPLYKYQKDIEMIRSFNFKEYELIGLGVPTYYFHPPYHILFELEHFPRLNNKKGFLFCTSGGNPGSTVYQLQQALKHTGIKIIDGYDRWIGWDVHQMYSSQLNSDGHIGWLPSSHGHPDDDELEQAFRFGKGLIDKALDPYTPEKTDFWSKENPSARMWSWKGIQSWFPEFNINEEKCTKCGICTQVCPWDAIILDPYPKWIKDCDRCYICDLKCPEIAIECDFKPQIEYLQVLMKKRNTKEN